MMKKIISLILVTTIIISAVCAGNFTSNIERLVGKNAEAYAMPLLDGFGSSLNVGVYKKASVSAGKLFPLGFDIGLVSMVTAVPSGQQSFKHDLDEFKFTLNLSSEIDDLSDLEMNFSDIYKTDKDRTPNIAGKGDGVNCTMKEENVIFANISKKLLALGVSQEVIESKEDKIRDFIQNDLKNEYKDFSFPGGLGVENMGAVAIQTNFRFPFIGLEVSGRYLPSIKLSDEVGDIDLYGFGLRKSLPVPVIDVTAGIFYQKMKIGDIFEFNSNLFHLEAGKSLELPLLFQFSPYVGLGYSQSEASLRYTITKGEIPGVNKDKKVEYDLDSDGQMIFTMGLTAQIIPFTYINFEFNQSEYSSFGLNLGIIIK